LSGVLTKNEEALVRQAFDLLQRRCHELAVEKGWHETTRALPDLISLAHSELSEALDEYRHLRPDQSIADTWIKPGGGKPVGVAIELADCLIRLFDTAEFLGLNLGDALVVKHQYNSTRPRRHGGLRC